MVVLVVQGECMSGSAVMAGWPEGFFVGVLSGEGRRTRSLVATPRNHLQHCTFAHQLHMGFCPC